MDYFPLFFDVKQKPCLVIGGGEIASRKIGLLVRAGASLRVVAPEISAEVLTLLEEGDHELIYEEYDPRYLDGVLLAVSATDIASVNEAVSQDAQAHNVPVNVVDNPSLCTFIFPAIIDRSPIIIAVSSGGQSPVLARTIRARLESTIPAAFGKLGQLVGGFREQAKATFKNIEQRRLFWESVMSGPVADAVFHGEEEKARHMLEERFAQANPTDAMVGEVYLVGAGPGDPDLLTFKALRLMQQADVVLYDRLVSPAILDMVRRDARRIYVGKKRDDHAVPQDQINQYLVDLALAGHRVCRLKGGDPFIFGRGGEEIDKLAEHGINFQVVPGITAASGCASYSGIPLTHRDYSQSVRFVTGHLKADSQELDWANLAQDRQTLVFYMGLVALPKICDNLIANGLPDDYPAALIQQGTTDNHKVIVGNLSSLPALVLEEQVVAPTLIIVGNVVKLHEKLQWFRVRN